MEGKKTANRWLVPALLVLVILLLAAVLVFVLRGRGPEEIIIVDEGPPLIGYAEGVTVVDDESSLQDAVDRLFNASKNEMVVSYRPQAISEDGTNFTCYIANSEYNEYDMFIALYADLNGDEDPYFLSGLMRPGEAFREISLDKSLDKGTHRLYLALTQVEDDHATIHGQSLVTLEMRVI